MSAPELERRSPLAGVLAPGVHGAGGPGVTIAERRNLSLVQMMARRGNDAEVAARLGFDLSPGRASDIAAGTALWLAPGAWMVVAERPGEGALLEELRAQLGGIAALVEQSHGRAALRLSGPRARDVLAKGCRLDLHPRSFTPGMCAQTTIAQIGVLLHQADDQPTYDLYVLSSYAAPFLDWLTASAAELGYRVQG